MSELQVDRNKESIFGIDVGICALHEEEGSESQRVRSEQAPYVPHCMAPFLLALGRM